MNSWWDNSAQGQLHWQAAGTVQLASRSQHAGKADGAAASACLPEAFEITEYTNKTRYWFLADARASNLENHPAVMIEIDRQTGRILRCGTCVPCW